MVGLSRGDLAGFTKVSDILFRFDGPAFRLGPRCFQIGLDLMNYVEMLRRNVVRLAHVAGQIVQSQRLARLDRISFQFRQWTAW